MSAQTVVENIWKRKLKKMHQKHLQQKDTPEKEK